MVHFKIRDVYIPEPETLLFELHGDDLLQGKVVALSDSGTGKEEFAVVEIEDVEQSVIVPVSRIRGAV